MKVDFENELYFSLPEPKFSSLAMDLTDMNYWGIVVVPIGVVICFGPAMLIWWLVDSRREQQRQPARAGR